MIPSKYLICSNSGKWHVKSGYVATFIFYFQFNKWLHYRRYFFYQGTILPFHFKIYIYWGLIDLQCCFSFKCTAKWISYTFIHSSLVAQMVKTLPAMWETWIWSLGWEDPLKMGMVTDSSILACRIPMNRGPWRATVHGVAKNWTWLRD